MVITGYGKIYAFGKAETREVIGKSVVIQEKIDGSQFSFAVAGPGGGLLFASKNNNLNPEKPEGMFKLGIEQITQLTQNGITLRQGYIYRGEFLNKPKHNALVYERTPKHNVMLFDIQDEAGTPLPPPAMRSEATRIGLDHIPFLAENVILESPEQFMRFMKQTSCLGGSPMEGVVIKTYEPFMAVKYVSEAFKEVFYDKRKRPITKIDVIDRIAAMYTSSARWLKAVQALRESGQATNTPADIGTLRRMVQEDILSECKAEIVELLFEDGWSTIQNRVVNGLPEWYKAKLMNEVFSGETAAVSDDKVTA